MVPNAPALGRALMAVGGALTSVALFHYATGICAQSTAVPLQSVTEASALPRVQPGDAIGRLEIPRIRMSLAVFEGVSDSVLRKGPGHLPGTSYPGLAGGHNNTVLAAHRDSFFRRLSSLKEGDSVFLTGPAGVQEYRLARRRVVLPEETRAVGPTSTPQLTLVTCYPFRWIGAAPYRLIWEAAPIASRPDREPRVGSPQAGPPPPLLPP